MRTKIIAATTFITIVYMAQKAIAVEPLCGTQQALGTKIEIVTLDHFSADMPQLILEHEVLSREKANQIVGKTIRFEDGKEVYVAKVLGTGGTSTIVSDGSGSAYRINTSLTDAVAWFLQGKEKLDSIGAKMLPVLAHGKSWIKVPEVEILPFSGLVVKPLPADFKTPSFKGTIEELLIVMDYLKPEDSKKFFDQFVQFMKRYAYLSEAIDINKGNIVYTKSGWELIDITGDMSIAEPGSKKTLFDVDSTLHDAFKKSGKLDLIPQLVQSQLAARRLQSQR